jgi:hypothetical protein
VKRRRQEVQRARRDVRQRVAMGPVVAGQRGRRRRGWLRSSARLLR